MSSLQMRRAGLPALISCCLLLPALGCNQHRAGSANGSAPGLSGDMEGKRAPRDLSTPNGPFAVPASRPRLTHREPLLDVDAVPRCGFPQLSLFESRAQANGASHSVRLNFVDHGAACRLSGFPSITFLRSDGSVVNTIQIRKVSGTMIAASVGKTAAAPPAAQGDEEAIITPSAEVLLTQKDQASFEIGWTGGDPGCDQVTRLAVAAPETTESIYIPRSLNVCGHQVMLTAVAGAGTE